MDSTRNAILLTLLNPYQRNWMIKVRVTNKGTLKCYKNSKGEGCVFSIILTDENGTQIQATMFNKAAEKYYPIFECGKIYHISKGSVRPAKKEFSTLRNDYELNINEYSLVEQVDDVSICIPEVVYNFVRIDQLQKFVAEKKVVDVLGIVQSVSAIKDVRRKFSNEIVQKRDITIADDSTKTVNVAFWGELAMKVGSELMEMVDKAPIVAITCVRVGDFQGLSLSTLSNSNIAINPNIPESKTLRIWYDTEGKNAHIKSTTYDKVMLSHIVDNPSLGHDKSVFFSVSAYIYLTLRLNHCGTEPVRLAIKR